MTYKSEEPLSMKGEGAFEFRKLSLTAYNR